VLDLGFDVEAELRPPSSVAHAAVPAAAGDAEQAHHSDDNTIGSGPGGVGDEGHVSAVDQLVEEEHRAKRACVVAAEAATASASSALGGAWAAAAAATHLEVARISRAKGEAIRLRAAAEAGPGATTTATPRSPRGRASKKKGGSGSGSSGSGSGRGGVAVAAAEAIDAAAAAADHHSTQAMRLDPRLMGKPIVEASGSLFLPLVTLRLLENCLPLAGVRDPAAAAAAAEAMKQELDSALQAYQQRNQHAIKA
jgi:hypothetical protein